MPAHIDSNCSASLVAARKTSPKNGASLEVRDSSSARAFSSANSSGASCGLSSKPSGRSSGVALSLAQIPERSGAPSAVRGTVHGSGLCPAAVVALAAKARANPSSSVGDDG